MQDMSRVGLPWSLPRCRIADWAAAIEEVGAGIGVVQDEGGIWEGCGMGDVGGCMGLLSGCVYMLGGCVWGP
jgi:hypothetical protein